MVGDELNTPFEVTIVDPCLAPEELAAPNGLVDELINYTIAAPGLLYEFGQFRVKPDFCEVNYSYTINDALGQLVISDFDD